MRGGEGMEMKGSFVVLVVGLLVGSMLGYAVAPSCVDTAALENQISDLNSQVSTLQSEVQTKNENITELETKIQTKNETIILLQRQVSDLESEIQSKNATITELQGNISKLTEEVSVLESEIQNKNKIIAELEEEVKNLRMQLEIEVLGIYFSPDGGCKSQVIYWAGRANESIHVLIYSFTLDNVSDALIDAYNSGVEVQVIFEKQQISQYSEYSKLKQAGVAVRNDTNSGYMHNKVMIIDDVLVLTGSFNWSAHAEESNNENLIVIKSTYIAQTYEEEFQKIWTESI
jgi:phosphatidylserine/phosphatidylglycerophosphate/cardiolipin synthase-like enzyme